MGSDRRSRLEASGPGGGVPVSMGSPRFQTLETSCFLVTRAWFPAGSTLDPHVHDRTTFAVILRGGFDLAFTSPALRRRRLPCPPGTVFTEPAGEKHANHVSEDGALVVVLQPDPSHEDLLAPFQEVLEAVHHFRHGSIETAARGLAREVGRDDDLSHVAAEGRALEMLSEAARLGCDRREPGGDGRAAWLRRAVDYVHAHFRETPVIADVAEAAGVHPAHLASVFRDTHGVPLATYMRRLRVEWAADRLLEEDEASLSSIALRAGFSDQSHFTNVFREMTGWTPGAYRASRR